MTTRLALYNEALTTHLGERKLASLSENREPRRVLDDIWSQGFIDNCLEEGMWKFALRTSKLTYDPSITTSFGYSKGFTRPTDYINLVKLSVDEYQKVPLLEYSSEGTQFFSDFDEMYMSYVSNDATLGGDPTLWPESFTRYAAAYLAYRACMRITQSDTKEAMLLKVSQGLLKAAKSKDAMEGPTVFPPVGSWISARRGGSRGDRGSRNQLIG